MKIVALILAIVLAAAAGFVAGVNIDGAKRLFAESSQQQRSEPPANQGPPMAVVAERSVPPPAVGRDPMPAISQSIPDVNGLVILIRTAILALNQANITGNYAVLRDLAAPGFQQANSIARLSENFAAFRARNVDLTPIAVVDPQVLRQPSLDERGRLRLTGFFATRPEQVNFDLAFELVDGRWRLFGIGVDTVPSPQAGASDPQPAGLAVAPRDALPQATAASTPDAAAVVGLIRAAVTALDQANRTGNYSVLRDLAAPGFQQANTLAGLAEAFASLRARDLDLGPITAIVPKLVRPPQVAGDKLRLSGFFASRPEQVNFDLAFQAVDGDWRLFGIGLNTTAQATASEIVPPPAAPAPVADAGGP